MSLNKSLNSLGLAGKPQDHRVVVAMSGGVDSSVVAGLLVKEGFDVIGMTMQLYDHGAAIAKKGACCAGQDIYDAKRVADKLGIPHFVLDYESLFKQQVMDDFVETYLGGSTPVPCIRCNQDVKFKDLLQTAKDMGASALATGHYIQRLEGKQGAELHRAVDLDRDQSYFLFTTTKEQLEFVRFPLGGMPKAQTRALAAEFGLIVADKPDSQDICFVPDGKYTAVIEKMRPDAGLAGDIVHKDGRVLGQHKGIIHYTVGQRRGLRISNPEPLFVIKVDAEKRQVIVGSEEDLLVKDVSVKEINWLGDIDLKQGDAVDILVKVRSMRPPKPATLTLFGKNEGVIHIHEGEKGVAPGQAAVFYSAEAGASRVLGGGWIRKE
jgi:tRNA-uridine 2-sulfurtransferase